MRARLGWERYAWAGVTGRKGDSSVQVEQPVRFGGGKTSRFLLMAFLFSGKVAVSGEPAGCLRFEEKGESLRYSSGRVN